MASFVSTERSEGATTHANSDVVEGGSMNTPPPVDASSEDVATEMTDSAKSEAIPKDVEQPIDGDVATSTVHFSSEQRSEGGGKSCRGATRHLHERSDKTPDAQVKSTSTNKWGKARGQFNTTHSYSDRNGHYYKDDRDVSTRRKIQSIQTKKHTKSSVFDTLQSSEPKSNESRSSKTYKSSISLGQPLDRTGVSIGAPKSESQEAAEWAITHAQFLRDKAKLETDHLAHSPSVKLVDPRKEPSSSRFNRPWSFKRDGKTKRRVPHFDSHEIIFHEHKGDIVSNNSNRLEDMASCIRRGPEGRERGQAHFLHHSNEDHISLGMQVNESSSPSRIHERHHHFGPTSVFNMHTSWSGSSAAVGFDESQADNEFQIYGSHHGHTASKKHFSRQENLNATLSPSNPIRPESVKVMAPPGGAAHAIFGVDRDNNSS